MHKLPLPYVAFFQGPEGRADRFQVQGMIDREAIGCAVQALVDLLDTIDGDPDVELNGDELDANHAEDDFVRHYAEGPGCPIADPDHAVDDQACDPDSEDGL